jgi:hypothetical protein
MNGVCVDGVAGTYIIKKTVGVLLYSARSSSMKKLALLSFKDQFASIVFVRIFD